MKLHIYLMQYLIPCIGQLCQGNTVQSIIQLWKLYVIKSWNVYIKTALIIPLSTCGCNDWFIVECC